MIVPVRCFTCGGVVAHKYAQYMALVEKERTLAKKTDGDELLSRAGLKHQCCRRTVLSHVEYIDNLLEHAH